MKSKILRIMRNIIINAINFNLRLSLHKFLTRKKEVIPYLEFHATEHCNLNCKGCGHFSCIAEPEFIDIKKHIKDMKRLSKLIKIRMIRILGGEPLLHPDINKLISETRKYFPLSNIYVVTNGILLKKMPKSFWNTLKKHSITIIITVYPPMESQTETFINLCKSNNIELIFGDRPLFFKRFDVTGSQDKVNSFKNCDVKECHYLENGKIAGCGVPFYIRHFNKEFNKNICLQDDTIDIYDSKLTGAEITKLLNSPLEACKYCNIEATTQFDWDVSKRQLDEWIVN
jgi:hypothetical protein